MARVSEAEVESIMEDLDSSDDISAFITAANLVVTEKLGSSGLSSSLLKEIERWLSAHFVTCMKRIPTKIKVGETENSYDWVNGEGLNASRYGQTVKMLDTTGTMSAELGKPGILFDVLMDLPTDTDT